MKISDYRLTAAARNELNVLNDLCNGEPKLSDLMNKVPEVFLLSADDLGKIFGVEKRTIYRWRREGVLPDCISIQQQIFWRLSDLKSFLQDHLEKNVTQN